jgi:signal transduction histidine kinase
VTLTIGDDGVGLPDIPPGGKGMGLRIMAYRASVIGAIFTIERLSPHGTRVRCQLPGRRFASETHAAKN